MRCDVAGELAGDAAVDHDDIKPLDRLLQNVLDLLGVAAAPTSSASRGRRADRQDLEGVLRFCSALATFGNGASVMCGALPTRQSWE